MSRRQPPLSRSEALRSLVAKALDAEFSDIGPGSEADDDPLAELSPGEAEIVWFQRRFEQFRQ
jgi:hypothetical protein